MLVHPDFSPIALSLGTWHLGSHAFSPAIHWYGLMYLLAFVSTYMLLNYSAKKQQTVWHADMISDMLFYGALGVMLGGRVGYVLFYEFDQFIQNPMWLFRVWEGGMSFHGGFIGVMLAMWLFARKYKLKTFQILDFVAPAVPLGLMFGRFGNFINGELWGRVVTDPTYPLAMIFPHVDKLPRHPSQLYQAFGEGLLLFIVLWWFSAKPRPRYAVSALFLMGYGVARFMVEFFRQPDYNQQLWFGWMSKGQLLTVPMLIIGLMMLIYAYRNNVYDWGNKASSSVKIN